VSTGSSYAGAVGGSPLLEGDVERALGKLDWSLTSVGAPAAWPAELSTVVRALLGSRFSMWMGWGPELTFFYNDAYARDTLGRKHPWALGRPASEVWSEIWSEIGPRIRRVVEHGEATWDERLLLVLERNGEPEETYHTFSYSPLYGAGGEISGMLCVVSEETERVIGERRMNTLRTLAEALMSARTEEEMVSALCERMAENRYDLPFSLVYLYDEAGEARLACAAGIDDDHPAAPASLSPHDPAAPWPLPTAGETILIESLPERFTGLPAGAWDRPPCGALVVPLETQTGERPAGFLIAALNPLRPCDTNYSGFVSLLAGQVAAGIGRARAYQREQEQARALAALDRAKTEFFSNVSHELRTPLTLIMAPVEDALADEQDPLPDPQRERLEMVRRNARRLRRMVGDILDFSRIERQGVGARRTAVDLTNFTAGLVASFAPAIERTGLELREDLTELEHPVLVDTEMWEKIVLNLLSNALKFTLTGFISVSLREANKCVELEVADSGVGIPEAAIPRLFERFYRVGDPGGRSYEGSGIGLALVHELVSLHEGRISVDSRAGEGSRFTVRVPYSSEAAAAVAPVKPSSIVSSYLDEALSWHEDAVEDTVPAATPRDPAGSSADAPAATVLVVDDNADLRSMLRRLLAPRYRVLTATDGEQALNLIAEHEPDLVLSDVMMPRVDGLELVRRLRADPATASLPVILLSARAGEEASIGGLEAGADDYLIKPFSARELVARVRGSLELAAVRSEAAEALRVERRRLEETLAQMPVGVLMAQAPDGGLMLVNDQVRRILGHPVQALADRPPGAGPSQGEHALSMDEFPLVRALRHGETTRDLELHYGRPDGSQCVLQINAAPIRDASGRIFAAVSVFQDVTPEVRRRRLLAAHRDILARVSQGATLERTLAMIVRTIEQAGDTDDARASILLVADDHRHLDRGVAPNLPEDYNQAIDGIAIGEGQGSCGTAAHRRAAVVVSDTLTDPLWDDFRDLARRFGLRACWSSPLLATDGELLGTFAIYHGRPWEPSDDEQQLVALLSQTASVAIERDASARARAKQFDEMQQGLRPRRLASVPGLEVASRFQPGTRGLEVGGDFYDVFPLGDHRWGFMIGDVCGHGAEAAAATAVARHTARAVALREPNPGAVLAAIDDALHRSELERYCTAIYGRLIASPHGFTVELANGGHPPPVLLRASGEVEFIRPHGPLLGVLEELPEFPLVTLQLGPGDALLSYTDGLIERNPALPGEAGLLAAAKSLHGLDAEAALARLEQSAVSPRRVLDDVALLMLRIPTETSG
jgi:PAS domain S-box-containing protein